MNKELKPYHVHLICNAKYHDSDFARVELLKLLYEHDDISVTVSDSYDNFEIIRCQLLKAGLRLAFILDDIFK